MTVATCAFRNCLTSTADGSICLTQRFIPHSRHGDFWNEMARCRPGHPRAQADPAHRSAISDETPHELRSRNTFEAFDKLARNMDVQRSGAFVSGVAPPERIDLDDIVLRRWEPDDLMARFEAVKRSYSAIHPWMEWLCELATLEQQRAFGAKVAASWPDPEGSCQYGIFDRAGAVVGAIGLHDRVGPGALEIGYWCHIDYVGRGIITRSAGRLTDMALGLPGIERVEIRCGKANIRSASVARRLGYRLDRVEPRPVRAPAESGLGMIWVRTRAS
jgi:RimJ/RimL family protein N-acetyltransferase